MSFPGYAATVGFVANPTGNSTDWSAYVLGLAGVIDNHVNFDTHPNGPLQGAFYTLSDGVTLIATGDDNVVTTGTGPGQGNTFSTPLSSGEGPHPSSPYLYDGPNPSSLTVTFARPVLGAGLFVIDYFNPDGGNPLRIEAYSGPNASGTLLGAFTSEAYNFQPNNLYFMGVASDSPNIGSIRFVDVNSNTGDITGIDDLRFATVSGTPDAGASLALFGIGLLGLVGLRRQV